MSGLVPLVQDLDGFPDPAELAARFLDSPYLLFLDSAAGTGFSYLAADPAIVVRSKGKVTEVMQGDAWRMAEGDALDVIRGMLQDARVDPAPGLPPFQGGAAGYIGYDYGAVLERVPPTRHDDLALHDVLLGFYDWVIAWDHRQERAWIVSLGLPACGSEREGRARERMEVVAARATRRLDSAETSSRATARDDASPQRRRPTAAPSYPVTSTDAAVAIGLRSTFTHRGYLDAVAKVREYIVAGDIFQANLSQRFQAPLGEPPFELYRRLRQRNPAPFAAYLGFGDVVVLSVSPERFLRLDHERQVETRPIKGTRPRGLVPMHDAALGRALAESEKDRAENVMIVDLLRNDLSRVCRPGTVRVPELFALEQHPTVHHLVSTVVGELEPAADAVDLVRAAFPGGSITGAPKVRAMEIIAELEPTRRGVYCGAIGYLSATGAMDSSIVIRTFVATGGELYFQAGGGIVADSDPELEYRETMDKARALIEVLKGAADS
ncbi:MAG: aminodeoxychorismate synthase component I [Gemmatimonadales bacterium]|nr:aminodeoxychorismate synthase component I [Gemmatimonadales bacterium]